MRRETIDLEDAIPETEEDVRRVRDAQQELLDKIDEEYDDFSEVPAKFQKKHQQLEEQRKELVGRISAVVADVLTFDGHGDDDIKQLQEQYEDGLWGYYREEGPGVGPSEFTISELTGGQLAEVQDEVSARASADALASGNAQDMNGTRVIATLRASVDSHPAGAPEDPAELRWKVMLYLFEQVSDLNAVGSTDFRTTSLRQAMEDDS